MKFLAGLLILISSSSVFAQAFIQTAECSGEMVDGLNLKVNVHLPIDMYCDGEDDSKSYEAILSMRFNDEDELIYKGFTYENRLGVVSHVKYRGQLHEALNLKYDRLTEVPAKVEATLKFSSGLDEEGQVILHSMRLECSKIANHVECSK